MPKAAVVYDKSTQLAAIAVPPGDYSVEALYGSASFSQNLTLLEANRLIVSFVLDVGGIRVLPRVQGLGLAPAQTQSLVYALSGPNRGKLITISKMPGEILRVKAGDYRIESRFAAGNAVAVADVHVKPGVMSAVEIDHAAGLGTAFLCGRPQRRCLMAGDQRKRRGPSRHCRFVSKRCAEARRLCCQGPNWQ